ncbi:hypothetical protein WOLCODRAFT_76224 [Wolfiporia cocos MD-104 SS10]|uniref:Uncharacterized protein n=1 Tax=Wolfiporia cocos (strain MD-104) TaxID=742152 RepID=A0A2H3JQ89_WOLCO|nr:hypothetical protein WOLCODRAFT_76224 [Wolfiporia cocos MD-104 SS10]
MSLDLNLFTLNVTPSPDDPNVVDLVSPSGVVHYRKERVPGSAYSVCVYDPDSGSLLATATAPSATSKHKTVQLHNPDVVVELKYTGTLTFKWGFKWEEHEFEWRREECYILRKPDPAVLVAVTKEPAGRLKTTSIQILDYNLNRFDIDDRKGLEIVILTALFTFHDANDAYHAADPPAPASSPSTSASTGAGASETGAPVLPPRPPQRTGVERIAELHMLRALQGEGDANEVEVGAEGSVEEYAEYAHGLLRDEVMLFVTVRSASSAEVPKVLRVVEETKRLRHKSGLAEDEELHQYVTYATTLSARKGPRRINLDDPPPREKAHTGAYAPPVSVIIHLSKIDMPELRPRFEPREPGPEMGWVADEDGSSGAGRSDAGSERKKGKGREKESRAERARLEKLAKEQQRAEKAQRKLEKEKGHKKKGASRAY